MTSNSNETASVPSREAGPGTPTVDAADPSDADWLRSDAKDSATFLRRIAEDEERKFTDAESGLYIPNGIPANLYRLADWLVELVEFRAAAMESAAPIASLGERPAPAMSSHLIDVYRRVFDLDKVAKDAEHDYAEFGAASVIQRLCDSHEALRAELAALRSAVRAAPLVERER